MAGTVGHQAHDHGEHSKLSKPVPADPEDHVTELCRNNPEM